MGLGVFKRVHPAVRYLPGGSHWEAPCPDASTKPRSNRFRCYTVRGQGGVRRTNGLT